METQKQDLAKKDQKLQEKDKEVAELEKENVKVKAEIKQEKDKYNSELGAMIFWCSQKKIMHICYGVKNLNQKLPILHVPVSEGNLTGFNIFYNIYRCDQRE